MKKINNIKFILIVAILAALILSACQYDLEDAINDNFKQKGDLIVHFIDVGQGDSIFIQLPNGETSLIDGGTRASGENVVKYLKEQNVEKIDYLIATHPHEDHIGGLPKVVKNFEIGKIYMPDATANTNIFQELLKEIKSKEKKITIAKGGDIILNDSGIKYEILAPNGEKYGETNDYSIVAKLTYKDNSFLFTGDAEKISENEIIEKGYNLKSDVLKIGHHGGSTSTSDEFLLKVSPKYGVISLGKDNTYGHPHKETIQRLNEQNVTILRTDELGTIVMISDGKNIAINKKIKEEKTKSERPNIESYYIGNTNTKVYHSPDCNYLPKEENQIILKSKKEAEDKGFRPHEKCIK
jgi:competence protein ComEC